MAVKEGTTYLLEHQQLFSQKVDSGETPYWDLCNSGEVFSVDKTRDDFHIQAGPIGAFSEEQMAQVVRFITGVYGKEVLYLQQHAKERFSDSDKQNTWVHERMREFLQVNIGGFREGTLLAVVSQECDLSGCPQILGTIGALPGTREELVWDTVGWDGTDGRGLSSLPTNASLVYHVPPEIRKNFPFPEYKVREITRLATDPDLFGNRRNVANMLYRALTAALAEAAADEEQALLFNVHSKGLADFVDQRLGGVFVCPRSLDDREYIPTPTEGVLDTIHGLHYGPPEGVRNSIPRVMVLSLNEVISRLLQRN